MACESPTTTPTPYHILSLGKERKREDKGKEEVQERETQPGEDGERTGIDPETSARSVVP